MPKATTYTFHSSLRLLDLLAVPIGTRTGGNALLVTATVDVAKTRARRLEMGNDLVVFVSLRLGALWLSRHQV